MRRKTTAQHVRDLVTQVLDDRTPEASRGGHARTLADYGHDLVRSVEIAGELVAGSEVLDAIRGNVRGAIIRPEAREAAQARNEVRTLLRSVEVPFGHPVVLAPPATGLEGTAPLIRQYSTPFGVDDAHNSRPIVPGVPQVGAALINPTIPIDPDVDGHQITIADVGGADVWDYSAVYVNVARQLLDFAGRGTGDLIDRVLHDVVDLGAEEDVVGDLEAAATASLTIEEAEAAAGAAGRGPCSFLICNPEQWPTVRGLVASSWQVEPRPIPIVSGGATTVTLVGPRAFDLLVSPVETFSVDEPSLLGAATTLLRPYKLVIRNAAALRTVDLDA